MYVPNEDNEGYIEDEVSHQSNNLVGNGVNQAGGQPSSTETSSDYFGIIPSAQNAQTVHQQDLPIRDRQRGHSGVRDQAQNNNNVQFNIPGDIGQPNERSLSADMRDLQQDMELNLQLQNQQLQIQRLRRALDAAIQNRDPPNRILPPNGIHPTVVSSSGHLSRADRASDIGSGRLRATSQPSRPIIANRTRSVRPKDGGQSRSRSRGDDFFENDLDGVYTQARARDNLNGHGLVQTRAHARDYRDTYDDARGYVEEPRGRRLSRGLRSGHTWTSPSPSRRSRSRGSDERWGYTEDYRDVRKKLGKVPVFNGEISFKAYLSIFEHHVEVTNAPYRMHAKLLLDALQEGCKEGRTFANEIANAGKYGKLSYDQIIAESELFFESGTSSEQVMTKLMMAKQGPEDTLEDWYQNVTQLRQEAINQGRNAGVSVAYVNDFATTAFLRGLADQETAEVLLITGAYPKELRKLYRAVQQGQLRKSSILSHETTPRQASVRAVSTAPPASPPEATSQQSDIQQLQQSVAQLTQQLQMLMNGPNDGRPRGNRGGNRNWNNGGHYNRDYNRDYNNSHFPNQPNQYRRSSREDARTHMAAPRTQTEHDRERRDALSATRAHMQPESGSENL